MTGEFYYHHWAISKLVARYASGGLVVGDNKASRIASYVEGQLRKTPKPARTLGPIPTNYSLKDAQGMLLGLTSRFQSSPTIALHMAKFGLTPELFLYLSQEFLPRGSVTNWQD